jgi:hypothetical protein
MIFMIKRSVKAKLLAKSSKKSVSSFPVKRNPPIVVHIGNVGLSYPHEELCAKTKKFSSKFPNIKFVGVDLRGASSTNRNWKQIKGDAVFGLKSLKDNSVSIIRSEMALGYYTSAILGKSHTESLLPSVGYAKKVMEVAIKKLKPNGKLVIVADKSVAEELVKLKNESGFSKVTLEPVANEGTVSYWTKKYTDLFGKEFKGSYMVTLTFIK